MLQENEREYVVKKTILKTNMQKRFKLMHVVYNLVAQGIHVYRLY